MSSTDKLEAMLEHRSANDQATALALHEQEQEIMRLQRGSPLERELATQAARFNIEGHCDHIVAAGHRWRNLDTAERQYEADVLKSVAYLEQRNMLDRHPEQYAWVRVLED